MPVCGVDHFLGRVLGGRRRTGFSASDCRHGRIMLESRVTCTDQFPIWSNLILLDGGRPVSIYAHSRPLAAANPLPPICPHTFAMRFAPQVALTALLAASCVSTSTLVSRQSSTGDAKCFGVPSFHCPSRPDPRLSCRAGHVCYRHGHRF